MRKPRNLLVTGGAGFIGGNFVHYWVEEHPEDMITVIDALTYAGNVSTLKGLADAPSFSFIHGDITNPPLLDELLDSRSIDTIVHFAAESHVDRSIIDPGSFVKTNVLGTQSLLDASRKYWTRDKKWKADVRFHHVSTDEVYGTLGPHDEPFTEATPYAPNSPYAASKAGSDHLVRAYHHTYGLPATISNCSNNYGPYQFPEKLIPLMIVNALLGKPLPIYGDGKQIRDWLFVRDHCMAIDRVMERGRAGETYNVGGRAEHTNMEIVSQICSHLDEEFEVSPELRERFPDCPASRGLQCKELIVSVRDRPGHDRRYAINPARISDELNFEPLETLDSGIKQTIDWYLQYETWWRAVMDGSYRDWMTSQYGTLT